MAAGGLLGLLMLGFWLWALYDVITTPDGAARHLPKLAWVFVIALLWVVGAAAWLLLGRPASVAPGGARSPAWHPALDERTGVQETPRERVERDRREFYRRMDEELDRRLAEKGGVVDEPPDPDR